MTQKNNKTLATDIISEASSSMPNLINNQANEVVEIMTQTFKDIETGEELSRSTTYTVESIKELVEVKRSILPTQTPKFDYLNNLINPFCVGFSEPIKYGDYLKIEEGDNLIRILTPAIIGIEWWTEELDKETNKIKKRPNRLPLDLALSDCPVLDWSYFNACYVYNYKAQKVQILSTTKRGVINGIKNLVNKPKWGDIVDYDINITKTLKTPNDPKSAEYTVTPEPKAGLEDEVITKWQQSGQKYEYLTLLYQGLDPFEKLRAGHDLDELAKACGNKINQVKVNT